MCQASVTPDVISTFSNINRHKSPLLTQYNLILSSTELYWPSTTMYQPVPPHTDPVPPSISHYRPKLTQFHQVLPHTDPVTPSTGQYRPILSQFHQVPTITVLYWPCTQLHHLVSRKAQLSQLDLVSCVFFWNFSLVGGEGGCDQVCLISLPKRGLSHSISSSSSLSSAAASSISPSTS